ncbi:LytTR family two component transcriptional regulator [Chitinophaga niastensis]|uniref:LytTR family two component transcriptional regulator n=1 Tax=Chitinophaga niastensis TaxID=536980 RepID=A0A2P8HNY8_CHINA|nr:LytTR family DNA-binding domain-containing protein [Chitinophaga niastensis]PSL47926.1 LytTR family two component transcriptional regulator [Chitinophaga niastensis]
MNCIIVDDEPLAREGIELLVAANPRLNLKGCFNNAGSAAEFLSLNKVDLVFLDIEMPGMNGLDFAKSISPQTLVIFTTAYAEYALNSYEVDAIDYLVKPVHQQRFEKAVNKALVYQGLLDVQHTSNSTASVASDSMYVKADRKFFHVLFKDILFIEGLKDYVVLQVQDKKIITAMNIKTIYDQLPSHLFVRVSKSYIINVGSITTFDNNTIYINQHEISIGNNYRAYFFDEFVKKKLLSR